MAANNTFQYPLDIPWNESRGFGLNWWINNWDGNGSSGYHLGVDIPADPLIQVKAASDGIVIFAGPKKGYGNVVIIKHPNSDVTTLYGHLGKGLNVSNKDSVSKGQIIGYIGNSSENGGWLFTHLHFGIRKGLDSINANVCGNWPYVGYSQPCKKFTHEQQVDTWYNPSAFINEHLLPPIPPKQKLTVLSPNGGENWPAGSEQKIQWKYTGKQTTSVKIELQKGSSSLFTELIAFFVPTDYNGDGSYLWTIPATHETGTDYRIVVTSMENSKRTDASDGYFTISAPAPPPTPTPTPTPTPAPTGPVHNVNKNTDYTSIQVAINDASIGDEIDVYSGTYYENVNVNKQLILKGIGNPVIDANSNGSAITLSADGITLKGFKMIKANIGIRVTSDNNRLSDNEANLNAYFGISLYYTNNNTLINNKASNNYFGISMVSSSNNMLIGNNISANNAHGILTEDGNNNNTLIDNNVSSNNFDGIFLHSSNNNTLTGNNVSNNYRNGIYLWQSSNNNTLNGNSASNNSYGIVLEASVYNKVYQNNLVNNSLNCYDTGSNQWDNGTVGNYYSDYTGIDLNGDGIGDIPYPIPGGSNRDRYPLMNPYTG
ncbi:MAG: NosD domain-containing protein [bacterium]|nr:NosD domain-containing protein [bacterium]